eukprot:713270-Pyramimonas_sp.AAC.1
MRGETGHHRQVAQRQKRLPNDTLGAAESSLALKVDPEAEPTDNVVAHWSDEMAWTIPTLTNIQLKAMRDSAEPTSQKSLTHFTIENEDGEMWKILQKNQRNISMLCVMKGAQQKLQLVVTDITSEKGQEDILNGMIDICKRMSTYKLEKDDAEVEKVVLKKRIKKVEDAEAEVAAGAAKSGGAAGSDAASGAWTPSGAKRKLSPTSQEKAPPMKRPAAASELASKDGYPDGECAAETFDAKPIVAASGGLAGEVAWRDAKQEGKSEDEEGPKWQRMMKTRARRIKRRGWE